MLLLKKKTQRTNYFSREEKAKEVSHEIKEKGGLGMQLSGGTSASQA